jgi:hypothetical protein
MRLYLDDDSAAALLARLLRQAGHDVEIPANAGLSGEDDAVHLTHAVKEDRVFLTGNHRDFLNLHNLVMQVNGHHPGILAVRRDNDPRRDLTPTGTVRAIRNLEAANVPVADEYVILNHWR